MLDAVLKVNGGHKTTVNWHIGEPRPRHLSIAAEERCILLQANGDELEHILSNFQNIPSTTMHDVVVWTGDMADFIYNNLV